MLFRSSRTFPASTGRGGIPARAGVRGRRVGRAAGEHIHAGRGGIACGADEPVSRGPGARDR